MCQCMCLKVHICAYGGVSICSTHVYMCLCECVCLSEHSIHVSGVRVSLSLCIHSMHVYGVCTFVDVGMGKSVHPMLVYGMCACVGVEVPLCTCAKARERDFEHLPLSSPPLMLVRQELSLDLELGRQPTPAFLLSPLS